jgi:hypothetical protein
MGWRDRYKVHPAADVFPMMSDEELAKLGEDIKANGLKSRPTFIATDGKAMIPKYLTLLDGRNRLEAMERAGLELPDKPRHVLPHYQDAVAFVISANIRRRHLTKLQQAKLIAAAHKAAAEASPQVEEVPKKRHVKGKPGSQKDELKAAIVADAAKHGISESTVERAMAKAEGKTPKPAPKPGNDEYERDRKECVALYQKTVEAKRELAEALAKAEAKKRNAPSPLEIAKVAREAASWREFEEDTLEIDDELLDACRETANAWSKLLARLEQKRSSTLPQDGQSETAASRVS